jgi:hypothetical protein
MISRYRKTLTESLEEVKIRSLYMKGKEKESVEVIAKKLGMSIKDVKKLMGEANTNTDSDDEKSLKIKLDKEKDTDNVERQLATALGQIKILQQKLENEKNKAIKPEPNPDTGEVPLTIGVANAEFTKKKEKEKNGEVKEADLSKSQIKKVHKMADELPKKDFKDRYGKEKGDAVRYATATNIVKKKEDIKEDGHQDVSSSKRMCQTIIEDATQISQKLNSMSPEDSLDTWWTNKLAKSADNLNSARDYLLNPVEEEVNETAQGFGLVQKAKEIAKKFANNMSKAVAEIEKLEKGLSNNSSVKDALQKANESIDEENLDEFTSDMIKRLKKSYSTMPKTISPEQATALSKHLDRLDLTSLKQLAKEKIPFVTTLARNKIYKKTGKFEEVELEEKKLTVKKGDKVREINDFEWRTYSQMGYKLVGKDGEAMKEDRFEGARSLVETIKGLQNKAKKTGMPYSILKKVYDRGMAAWKGGHRPGASQQQWAFARVNSFVTKSSGTWGGADKDLAKQVRGK